MKGCALPLMQLVLDRAGHRGGAYVLEANIAAHVAALKELLARVVRVEPCWSCKVAASRPRVALTGRRRLHGTGGEIFSLSHVVLGEYWDDEWVSRLPVVSRENAV